MVSLFGKSGEIMDKLNFVNAKKGDVFFVESETIHAIGSGITVYEVQQNSTLTYRLFDYMRQDKDGNYRELHLKKAKDVSNLGVMPADKLKKQKPQTIQFEAGNIEKTILGYSEYVCIEPWQGTPEYTHEIVDFSKKRNAVLLGADEKYSAQIAIAYKD